MKIMERGRVHEKAKYSILVENFIRRYIMSKIYYVEDILCRRYMMSKIYYVEDILCRRYIMSKIYYVERLFVYYRETQKTEE